MSGHTPGPWKTGGMLILTDRPSTVTPDGRTIHNWRDIAEVRHFNGPLWDSPEGNANARLIAAAPELLAAAKCALADLEGIMPEFDPDGSEHPGWKTTEELRAAINKAEGRGQ